MTNATATAPRRPFLLEQKERLLVTRDAIVAAERLTEFVAVTGISPERLVTDPVVAIPLPVHARGERFDEVDPAALWHPVFWLPEDVALRSRIRETENAEPRVESDAEWAIRIAIELTQSELFSAENGWVDVFALYGIDTTDPTHLEAIQAWQAGLPDELLDQIDLRDHFNFSTENEALYSAQSLYPLVMSAQWGYTATSLLVAIEQDPAHVGLYASIAAEMLNEEPGEAPDAIFEAAQGLNSGGDLALYGPKITDALDGLVRKYADAIYELENL